MHYTVFMSSTFLSGAAMRPISRSPVVGETLTYRNVRTRVIVPVRVLSVKAAVCEVEILAGGLNDSLKGQKMFAHVALLFVKG